MDSRSEQKVWVVWCLGEEGGGPGGVEEEEGKELFERFTGGKADLVGIVVRRARSEEEDETRGAKGFGF